MNRSISHQYTPNINKNSPHMSNSLILPPNRFELHDPFLMCAEDWFSYPGGFTDHPHRGFETVTVILEGKLHHKDSKGNSGILQPGDLQWVTTGRGIIHAELPGDKTTLAHTLQLWLNLPKAKKMQEASYQDLLNDKIPVRTVLTPSGDIAATIRVISGESGELRGPAKNNGVEIKALDITVSPGQTIQEPFPALWNMFGIVLAGTGFFGKDSKLEERNVFISPPTQESTTNTSENDPSILTLTANENGLRVILFAGKPIQEPVVQRGPFVGNTKEDIEQAFSDYYSGKFQSL